MARGPECQLKSLSYCDNRAAKSSASTVPQHKCSCTRHQPGVCPSLSTCVRNTGVHSLTLTHTHTHTEADVTWKGLELHALTSGGKKLNYSWSSHRVKQLSEQLLSNLRNPLVNYSLGHKINALIVHPCDEQFCGSLSEAPACATWDAPFLHSREYWFYFSQSRAVGTTGKGKGLCFLTA